MGWLAEQMASQQEDAADDDISSSPGDFEAAQAKRCPTVVAKEDGLLLYQLAKTTKGEYYMIELYKDRESVDTHFKNMGAKNGAPQLDAIKPDAMVQIYPVVSAIL